MMPSFLFFLLHCFFIIYYDQWWPDTQTPLTDLTSHLALLLPEYPPTVTINLLLSTSCINKLHWSNCFPTSNFSISPPNVPETLSGAHQLAADQSIGKTQMDFDPKIWRRRAQSGAQRRAQSGEEAEIYILYYFCFSFHRERIRSSCFLLMYQMCPPSVQAPCLCFLCSCSICKSKKHVWLLKKTEGNESKRV